MLVVLAAAAKEQKHVFFETFFVTTQVCNKHKSFDLIFALKKHGETKFSTNTNHFL